MKKIIVIDTETTGLNYIEDDVLQVSMIDGYGKVILNTYTKPVKKSEWPEAMEINHITPEMVKDAPDLQAVAPEIIKALNEADMIVGYNVYFDLQMLEGNGVGVEHLATEKVIIDVMQHFAPIYGEWDDKRQDYKWKNLTTAAQYYGYDFSAHDSLEDVKATLFVYDSMKNDMIMLYEREKDRLLDTIMQQKNRIGELSADKYRWHNLVENPEDLPEDDDERVLVLHTYWHYKAEAYLPEYETGWYVPRYEMWTGDAGQGTKNRVLGWKKIEPFELPELSGILAEQTKAM